MHHIRVPHRRRVVSGRLDGTVHHVQPVRQARPPLGLPGLLAGSAAQLEGETGAARQRAEQPDQQTGRPAPRSTPDEARDR
ncbi:hypothetical protein [Streptomyces violaceusniger]|uniref:hypothetical protein n=1 Tax=Streptomyces violaceusniger TaxID=68280 RepID=UPI0031D28386